MEMRQGIEITVEVKGIENYAKCVLHFTNIKYSRDAVADVKTVEGTDLITITGYKQFESALKGTAEEYGEIASVFDKVILEITDEDIVQLPEVNKAYDEWFENEDADDIHVVGKFENK